MKEKKKFKVPSSFAIIVAVMLLASILTYVIPGGQFERTVDESGKTVVVAGSFQYIDPTPVNPLSIMKMCIRDRGRTAAAGGILP